MSKKKIQTSLSFEDLYEIASKAVIEKQKRGEELTDSELDLLFEQVSSEAAVELANPMSGMPIPPEKQPKE